MCLVLVAGILSAVLTACGPAFAQPSEAESAVATALSLIGPLDNLDIEANATKAVIVKQDAIPLMMERLTGNKAWRVRVSGLRLSFSSTTRTNPHISELEVLLDAETGQPLKIASPRVDAIELLVPFDSFEDFEKDIIASGERFEGVPPKAPKVSFLEALDIAQSAVPGPVEAKGIAGYYVVYTRLHHKSRPAWVINSRGVPAGPMSIPAGLPAHQLKKLQDTTTMQMRHVVDAETGRVLAAETVR